MKTCLLVVALLLGCEKDGAESARDMAVTDTGADLSIGDLGPSPPQSVDGAIVSEGGMGGQPGRVAFSYRGDRIHHLRFGFAIDILGEVQTYAVAFAGGLDAMLAAGMKAPNGRPDLCINQVFRDSFHPCVNMACRANCINDCVPVTDPEPACCPNWGLLPTLRGLLSDWNLLLTLANLPYVTELAEYPDGQGNCSPITNCNAAQEQDVAEDLNLPPLYAKTICELLSHTAYTSFPPVFDNACLDSLFESSTYSDYLTRLHSGLASSNGEVAYETGNEPEARRFFWGDEELFLAKSHLIYDAIRAQQTDPPNAIFFGGYTGQTFSPQAAPEPVAAAQQAAFFDLYNRYRDGGRIQAHTPSFHLFRQVGYGENGNPVLLQEKTWARFQERADSMDLSGAAITAFNLYGSADECADPWRVDLMESDYFTYELAELLLFAHRNEIARVYFYKLLDFATEASKLGFIDENGEPKRAFDQVAEVWRVIEDGYQAYELVGPRRIRIVGQGGRTFEAAMAPLQAPPGASVTHCPSSDVRCLPPNQALSNIICELYASYNWHIYEEDGQGRPCIARKGTCDTARPCVLPAHCPMP